MLKKIKNKGLIIFPIQTVILLGRREKNSTKAKNIKENINNIKDLLTPSEIIGSILVKEVVAHLGIAKNGPIVR